MTTFSCANNRRRTMLQGPLLLVLALTALLSLGASTSLPKAAAASEPRSINLPLCFYQDTSPVGKGSSGFSLLGADPWLHVTASTATYAGGSGGPVKMRLVDALPDAKLVGEEMLPGRMNRLIGSDPAGWRTNVPLFGRLRAEEVYPGISLEYYGSQGQLEYDFSVSPKVDPGIIRWTVRGAADAFIDADGTLVLTSEQHTVRQPQPFIYQESSGRRERVEGGYRLTKSAAQEYEIGFRIGRYDDDRPLVIDPIIKYSSYLGGSGVDQGEGITLDAAGMVYVTGSTTSADFPHSSGSLLGARDAFVLKLDPSLSGSASLLYATFLGGTGEDFGVDISVDSMGRPAITGQTRSVDFPVFRGIMSDPGDGIVADGFVVQLTQAGDALRYSTYLGGESVDNLLAIDTTFEDRLVVAGATRSAQYPVVNAFQPIIRAGNADASVSVLDPAASGAASLLYSTYLGGGAGDFGTGVASSGFGRVYVSGFTRSTDFPISPHAFQGGQGGTDAFVVALRPSNSGANSFAEGTLLGGEADDQAADVSVSRNPTFTAVYVAGKTSSVAFPTTSDAIQRDQPGSDAFFTILGGTLSNVVSSTYLGGDQEDEAFSIQVDNSGGAVVVGTTSSTGFPTRNELMKDPGDTRTDAFVTRFSHSGKLIYSTYLGGNGEDSGTSVAVDSVGAPFVTGRTSSTNFPLASSLQGDRPGMDAFITALSSGPPSPPTSFSAFVRSSSVIALVWVDTSLNEDGFIVRRRTGGGSVDSSIFLLGKPGVTTFSVDVPAEVNKTYTYTVESFNDEGIAVSDAIIVATIAPPTNLTGVGSIVNGTRIVSLQWEDNSAIEGGYQVDRSVDRGDFFQIANLGSDSEAFVDNSAPNAAAYRVRAFNSQGFSSYTNLYVSEFEFAAPKNLTAHVAQKSDGSIQVTLQWQPTSRLADSIIVSKRTDGGAFFTAAVLGPQANLYLDLKVSQGHTYSYVLRSRRNTELSGTSNQANVRVAQFSAPTNLVATLLAPDRARLTYQDNAFGEFVYEIERRVGTGNYQVVVRHELVPVVETGGRVTDVPLIPGETNTFRVRAGAAFSNLNTSPLASPYSNEASVKAALPDPPTNVVATAVDSITSVLKWTDNSLGETGFVVEKSVNGGAFSVFRTVSPNVTTVTEGGRDGGGTNQNRSYRVRARNGLGVSAPGTSSVDMLAAPTSLTAAAGRGSKILNWKDNSIAETGFSVEARLKGTFVFKVVGTAAANATSFAVPLGAVEIEAARIRAVSGTRSVSSYSNIVSTVPVNQPAEMTATATDSTTVRLTWTDHSDNESGFELQRRGAGKPWTTIQDLPQGSEEATDTTAPSENEYQYRVRAVTGISSSEWCPEWPIVFTLNAPSDLNAKRTAKGVRLQWLDRSTHETGCEVERRVGKHDWERIKTLGANTSRFTDPKAPWGHRLRYRVRATGSNSASSYSIEAKAGG